MQKISKKNELFHVYFNEWIQVYKEGAVQKVTLSKYYNTLRWIQNIAPDLSLMSLDRLSYQKIINQYAETHEYQTTLDFHHFLKASIRDALDEGFIDRDPTRRTIIKGKAPRQKKQKYLSQFELNTLIRQLNLSETMNWDWFILLLAKTGLRFSEALALTPSDFDFQGHTISITKTLDYKQTGKFTDTKNRSSRRKIALDWKTNAQFSSLLQKHIKDKPIFLDQENTIYNSTINNRLRKLCIASHVPIISLHGLRHTHASLLLFHGVSIASVSRRLGHADIATTQKTYLHIIKELDHQDIELVMRCLASLN